MLAMRRPSITTAVLLSVIAEMSACSGHDSDYMPYDMKGMNAYLYDQDGREHFAGFSDGSYLDRESLLSQCRSNAFAKARGLHLDDRDWGYVCCTVTSESSCATKVR